MRNIDLRRLALPSACALFLASTGAGAQAPRVDVGDHVRLRLVAPREDPYPRMRFEGPLIRLSADSIALRDRYRTRGFALREVQQLEVRTQVRSAGAGALRHGIPAAVVGAALGAWLGHEVEGGGDCTLEPGGGSCGGDMLPTVGTAMVIGGTTGLLGALYGATVGRWGWMRLPIGRAASR